MSRLLRRATPGLSLAFAAIFSLLLWQLFLARGVDAELRDHIGLVRHAPQVNGYTEGSLQQLAAEGLNLNSGAVILRRLLVPGSPNILLNGAPDYGGVLEGAGAADPAGYTIVLNEGATLGNIVTRTDPVLMPETAPPPSPTGTRTVWLNAGQSPGDFATIRNLGLNANYGALTLPPGDYGDLTVNSGCTVTLGAAGPPEAEPAVYNLQRLTLNTRGSVRLAGPVALNLHHGFNINGEDSMIGEPAKPEWLVIRVHTGDININSESGVFAKLIAPNSHVQVNGTLSGGLAADRLTVNSSGELTLSIDIVPPPAPDNRAPTAADITVETPEDTPADFVLSASDPDNDDLTYEILTLPSHGILIHNGQPLTVGTQVSGLPLQVSYIPALNFFGEDAFTYRATDSKAAHSGPATAGLSVKPVNDAPAIALAEPDEGALFDHPVTLTLRASAADVEDDSLLVEFFANDNRIGARSGVDSFVLEHEAFEPGELVLRAEAVDSGDARVRSADVVVYLNNAPSVQIVGQPQIALDKPAQLTSLVSDDGQPPNAIFVYAWSKTSGPGDVSFSTPTQPTATAAFTEVGSYTLALAVSDGVRTGQGTIEIEVREPGEYKSVRPILDGVRELSDGSFLAFFGYLNENGDPIAIPAGPDNKFTPVPIDRGQAQLFEPGRTPYYPDAAFVVPFAADNQVWTLRGPDGKTRTATASPNSKRLNAAPSVAISTPAEGAVYERENTIEILVSAADPDPVGPAGIQYVEIFAGADSLGEAVRIAGTDTFLLSAGGAVLPAGDTVVLTAVATDVEDLSATSAPVSITIQGQENRPPTADVLSFTTTEDVSLYIELKGSDLDGDTLAFSLVTLPDPSTGVLYTVPGAPAQIGVPLVGSQDGGGFVVASNYHLVFHPAANYNGPAAFTYIATDPATIHSPPATVSITITPVNDAPTAENITVETPEDTPTDITLLGSDPDNDDLTYEILTVPSHGTLTHNGQPLAAGSQVSGLPSQVSFTPELNYFGEDTFTYSASDPATSTSPPATISITLTPVNDAPTAENITVETPEDTPADIVLLGSDPDNDELTYEILTVPAHGTLTHNGQPLAAGSQVSGLQLQVSYTPEPNYFGEDTFTYSASDPATSTSPPATVSITITPVNDAPTAENITVETPEDTPVIIQLLGADPDGDVVRFRVTAVSIPDAGALWGSVQRVDPALGTPFDEARVVFVPASDFVGKIEFFYQVLDPAGVESQPAVLTIDVHPENDPPQAEDVLASTPEGVPLTIELIGSDPENDELTFRIVSFPAAATGRLESHDGEPLGAAPFDLHESTVVFRPEQGYFGSSAFSFIVQDAGGGVSPVAHVRIDVQSVNDAPTVEDITAETVEDAAITLLLRGADADGDRLTYRLSNIPPGAVGSFLLSGSQLSYRPARDFEGVVDLTYTASDGQVSSGPGAITINVVGVNDPPQPEQIVASGSEDQPLPFVLTATDPEGGSVEFVLTGAVDGPQGVFTLEGTQGLFVPAPNWNGEVRFDYLARDDTGAEALGTGVLTVLPVNDPPAADAGPDQYVRAPAVVLLQGAASDIDGDALLGDWALVSGPAQPIIDKTDELRASVRLPEPGEYRFSYAVSDGSLSDTDSMLVVAEENQPPTLEWLWPRNNTTVSIGEELEVELEGYDPEYALERIELYVDGELVEEGENWYFSTTLSWSETGAHVLMALAYDDAGAVGAAGQRIVQVLPVQHPRMSVQAGSDRMADVGENVPLEAVVFGAEPGASIEFEWVLVDRDADAAILDASAASTPINFSEPGVYSVDVFARTPLGEANDRVTITVNPPHQQIAPTNSGTEFWFSFMGNDESVYTEPDRWFHRVVITAEKPTSGLLYKKNPNYWPPDEIWETYPEVIPFTAEPGRPAVIKVDEYWLIPGYMLQNGAAPFGYRITAEGPVNVVASSVLEQSTDGTELLPVGMLGREYIVMASPNNRVRPENFSMGTQLLVVATENNTTVNIHPTANSYLANPTALQTREHPAGVPFSVVLQQGETYGLTDYDTEYGDFTGTVITSDKPVAVYGGHACGALPDAKMACDHMSEQLMPTKHWGRQYIAPPMAGRDEAYMLRVLASVDGTTVTVGEHGAYLLNRGEYRDFEMTEAAFVDASAPVSVGQFAYGAKASGEENSYGDPFFTVVPAVEQYLTKHRVGLFDLYEGYWYPEPRTLFDEFISIAAPSGADVYVNGSLVPAESFQSVAGANGAYAVAVVEVSGPEVRVECAQPVAVFVNGWTQYESTGYAGATSGLTDGPHGEVALALIQDTEIAVVGTEHTVTAILTDAAGQPVLGGLIQITVDGVNAFSQQSVATNNLGRARFTYTGGAQGVDTITASFNGQSQQLQCTWVTDTANSAPSVDAGADLLTDAGEHFQLAAHVSDDGLPVGSQPSAFWRQLEGPVPVEFTDPHAATQDIVLTKSGQYVFEHVATDGMLSSRDRIRVSVNAPPLVQIQYAPSPVPDDRQVYFQIRARDTDGAISSVWLEIGEAATVPAVYSPTAQLWEVLWPVSVVPGTYTLRAVAEDNHGASATSLSEQLKVVQRPKVRLLSPNDGDVFSAGSRIPVELLVTDDADTHGIDAGVAVNNFYNHLKRVLLGTPKVINVKPQAGKGITLQAFAIDSDLLMGLSHVVSVDVVAPPQVHLSAAASGEPIAVGDVVPLEVGISSSASAADAIERVEFYVDGELIGVAEGGKLTLDWVPATSGEVTVFARVLSSLGYEADTAALTFNVGTRPVVVLNSPVGGQQLSAPVLVRASASDEEGAIASIQIIANGESIGKELADAIEIQWDAPHGWHSLTAVAVNGDGFQAVSTPVDIFVERTEDPELPAPNAPKAQVATENDTSEILVSWNAEKLPDGSRLLLEFRSSGNDVWQEAAVVPSQGGRYLVSGLDADSVYSFRLALLDEDGQRSPYSAEVVGVTQPNLSAYVILDLGAKLRKAGLFAHSLTDRMKIAQSGGGQILPPPTIYAGVRAIGVNNAFEVLLEIAPFHYVVWNLGSETYRELKVNQEDRVFCANRLAEDGSVLGFILKAEEISTPAGDSRWRTIDVVAAEWPRSHSNPKEIVDRPENYVYPSDHDPLKSMHVAENGYWHSNPPVYVPGMGDEEFLAPMKISISYFSIVGRSGFYQPETIRHSEFHLADGEPQETIYHTHRSMLFAKSAAGALVGTSSGRAFDLRNADPDTHPDEPVDHDGLGFFAAGAASVWTSEDSRWQWTSLGGLATRTEYLPGGEFGSKAHRLESELQNEALFRDINSEGTAVGEAAIGSGEGLSAPILGRLGQAWSAEEGSALEELPLEGYRSGSAMAINENGLAVGYASHSADGGFDSLELQAMAWTIEPSVGHGDEDSIQVELLQSLPLTDDQYPNGYSHANDVNDYGQVVGTSKEYRTWTFAAERANRAVLWERDERTGDFVPRRLDGVVPVVQPEDSEPYNEWDLNEAVAINDFGVITGSGVHYSHTATENVTYIDSEETAFVLLPVDMAVDANRDGFIKFAGNFTDPSVSGKPTDKTEEVKPFGFWLNDDDDRNDKDAVDSSHKDSDDGTINSRRDLEDFSPLNIFVGGLHEAIAAGQIKVGLKWKNTGSTSPRVKVWRNKSPNGSSEYLTNDDVAQEHMALGNPGDVQGTNPYIIPAQFWTDSGLSESQPNGYLLFEAVSEGKGQLCITLHKEDGSEIGEGPGVWLDLKNVKKMYVRAKGTPENGIDAPFESYFSQPNPPPTGYVDDPNGHPFQQPHDEADSLIVLVHGIHAPFTASPDAYKGNIVAAEIVFKRLWHQGFKGRFAFYKWPALNPAGFGSTGFRFNESEYRAWKYGRGLALFVNSINKSSKNLFSHSQGNIVCGAALTDYGLSVDNYVLTQAAVPAGCYDTSGDQSDPISINGYARFWNKEASKPTPDFASDLGYRGYLQNLSVSGNVRNFHNQFDYALATGTSLLGLLETHWEANQDSYKPDDSLSNQNYYTYLSANPPGQRGYLGDAFFVGRFVTDPYESMSMIARPRSKAVGALGATRGQIGSDFDLSAFRDRAGQQVFTRSSDDHGAQVGRRIQEVWDYYTELGDAFGVLPPR